MMEDRIPQVNLRALEPEDLELLYRIENDTTLWDCSTTNVPYSRYVLHQYIASACNDIYADGEVRMIVENLDGNVVGVADLTNFSPRHQRAEVGVVILAQERRNGYAYATLCQLKSHARNVLHLHQLYACVGIHNKASYHLFEKAGFLPNAQLKDWLFVDGGYCDAVWMQCIL